jgi:hypothetical protein
MNVNAPGKLAVLAVVVVGVLVYITAAQFTGADTTAAWATLSAVIGYLIGNGVGARRGQVSEPVFITTPAPPDPNP